MVSCHVDLYFDWRWLLVWSWLYDTHQESSLIWLLFSLQFVVSVFVLRMFLCESRSTKYIVAAGLAQVSEFSFVLGSRARRFHLISREVSLFSSLDNFWGDVILSVRYCDWDNKFYEPSSFFFQVYLIILSVTTISLLLAPLLWRISLWKFGSRKLWMSSGSERTNKRAARTI